MPIVICFLEGKLPVWGFWKRRHHTVLSRPPPYIEDVLSKGCRVRDAGWGMRDGACIITREEMLTPRRLQGKTEPIMASSVTACLGMTGGCMLVPRTKMLHWLHNVSPAYVALQVPRAQRKPTSRLRPTCDKQVRLGSHSTCHVFFKWISWLPTRYVYRVCIAERVSVSLTHHHAAVGLFIIDCSAWQRQPPRSHWQSYWLLFQLLLVRKGSFFGDRRHRPGPIRYLLGSALIRSEYARIPVDQRESQARAYSVFKAIALLKLDVLFFFNSPDQHSYVKART